MIDEKRLFKEIKKMIRPLLTPDGRSWFDDAIQAHNETLIDVLETIKSQPKVNEWIPVEERLPKEKEYVLIQNPYGVMSVACLLGGKWYNFQGVELWVAVAWMPLPKEYEKE